MDVEEIEAMAAAEENAKKGKRKNKKPKKEKKEKPVLSPEEKAIRRRKRVKIGLLVIVILLAGDLIFGIVHLSVNLVKKNRACSISSSTSRVTKEYEYNRIVIRDYVVYGENLSLFHYDYSPADTNDFLVRENAKFILKDECKKTTYNFDVTDKLDGNIDLSSLKEGNYHVYYQSSLTPLSLVSFEVFYPELKYDFYTLPFKKNKSDVNYSRRHIEISASNSLLLIKVNEEKYLPTDAVYDIAIDYIIGNGSEGAASLLKQKLEKKGLKVLLTSDTAPRSTSAEISNLRNMYNEKVKYAIRIDVGEDENTYIYHSSKTDGFSKLINNSADADEFINQLGGKSLGAGTCDSSSTDLSCGLTSAKNGAGINATHVLLSVGANEAAISALVDTIVADFSESFLK